MKNIFMIILILVNVVLIIISIHFIQSMDQLESRIVQIEKEVRSPEVRIIPVQ